jgi:heterodisulfide reductase subunit A
MNEKPEKTGNGSPRVGVYVCDCGSNIAATVDCKAVVEDAAQLPGVALAREYKYVCSEPGQEMIRQDIKEHNLNRVVVASCSPKMHEPTFQNTIAKAGLNPYYFAMANIREQVSWVIRDKAQATEKAKRLVRSMVARVALQEELFARKEPVTKAALVVGGGIAGIQAALNIAEAGYQVYMVEKSPSVGGHMAQLDKTFPTIDCSICILGPKMSDVGRHPNIKLMTYSEVTSVSGYMGNYDVTVRKRPRYVNESQCVGCLQCIEGCVFKKPQIPDEFNMGLGMRKPIYIPFPQATPQIPLIDPEHCLQLKTGKCKQGCASKCDRNAIDFSQKEEIVELKVGTIIVATGFEAFDPVRTPYYGYGKYPNVYTALEVERLVSASGPTGGEIILRDGTHPKSIGIIHCVGSRDEKTNRYCSKVCCMYSLKLAHLLKDHTDAQVYNFYIDMRTPGKGYEEFYNKLLEEGVNFIRGRVAQVTDWPITKEEEGKMILRVEDTMIGKVRRIPVDMVVLSTGLEPQPDAAKVATLFGISRSADGFFAEAHVKLRPVETNTDGVFLAGCAQGPRDVPDTVAHAGAAASMAIAILNKGEVTISPTIASVEEDLCSGCKTCLSVCPYTAITFDEEKKLARVNDVLCHGCGTCVAACPAGAIRGRHFTDEQIHAQIEALLREPKKTEGVTA